MAQVGRPHDDTTAETLAQLIDRRFEVASATVLEEVRLLRAIPGVKTTMPGGAFYVFPDVSAFFGKKTAEGQPVDTATDVAMYLLRQVAVASVPGEGFGAPAHIRFSYATSRQAMEQGIGRVAEALGRLR